MLWILSLHNNTFSNPTAQRWHVAGAIADTDEGKIDRAIGECWWYHKLTVQMPLVVDAYQPLLDDANRCAKGVEITWKRPPNNDLMQIQHTEKKMQMNLKTELISVIQSRNTLETDNHFSENYQETDN